MGTEVTLLTIYDKVSGVDAKLDAHVARVDAQLEHGATKMADHEARIRVVEAAIPDHLEARLTALERFRWGAAGMAALVGALCSGGVTTIIIWLLSGRH